MINNYAELICSYLKMNNKDDEFKINFTNGEFTITKNNQIIFKYVYLFANYKYLCFYINSIMIMEKSINKNSQIDFIDSIKIQKDYHKKYKNIYCEPIELNNKPYILYNFNKDYIVFCINVIRFTIHIIYHNRFIYKSYHTLKYYNNFYKYTNYKILIPNKYELLYYSKYFLGYL
jgi:hypothetical protein